MDEIEMVRVRIERLRHLDSDVEEAETVLQLFLWRHGLASDRWRSLMVRWRVVGARDR